MAQFFSAGNAPGTAKWNELFTSNYRIIYPAGADSLARIYALNLEINRPRVAASIGFTPNEAYRKKMPVILYTFPCLSNGIVTWAPRRMELFTVPDSHPLSSIKTEKELTIHESRHVAQMQLGALKPYRWLRFLSGELWAGAMSALYPGPAILEGDAVVAETELTAGGRGRVASFLNYYDICFAEGDWRDFYKWRYGSLRNYTPDHYRAGYFTISGIRAYFDDPDFSRRYFTGIGKGWPLPLFRMQRTVREASGMNFKDTFREISRRQAQAWEKEAEGRKPFMNAKRVSDKPGMFCSLYGTTTDGTRIWSIRRGLDRSAEIVEVGQDGKITPLRPVDDNVTCLRWNEADRRIWWSEVVPDPRWTLKSCSVIRYMTEDGKTHDLTRRTRYFNPCPCGDRIYAVEFPENGETAVVCLDHESGALLERVKAPDGIQISECCVLDGELYTVCTTDDGMGIFDSRFKPVLAPVRTVISGLRAANGKLYFTSDRNGSDELYRISPLDCRLFRLTSTRFGGTDYTFVGKRLYFSMNGHDDRGLFCISVQNLPVAEVSPEKVFEAPVAAKLSVQAAKMNYAEPETAVSAPRRYRKLPNAFKFHSWIPAYVNYDGISKLSSESLSSVAGIGATAFFHNNLNSLTGSIAYSAWNRSSGWRSSVHGRFTYNGLYPVIEGSFDIGDRNARVYSFNAKKDTLFYKEVSAMVNAGARIYIPVNLSSGGWNRGIIPQVRYSYSSDVYFHDGHNSGFHTVTTSLRAYSTRQTAPSCVYPRLGIGAEIGYSFMPGLRDLSTPIAYASVYGYLPGFARTHGIRVSATGYDSLTGSLSATYVLPFAAVDWSFLSPVAYIRNFELYVRGYLSNIRNDFSGFGIDLAARLGNLLWIPYDTRLGLSVDFRPSLSREPAFGFLFSIAL